MGLVGDERDVKAKLVEGRVVGGGGEAGLVDVEGHVEGPPLSTTGVCVYVGR